MNKNTTTTQVTTTPTQPRRRMFGLFYQNRGAWTGPVMNIVAPRTTIKRLAKNSEFKAHTKSLKKSFVMKEVVLS